MSKKNREEGHISRKFMNMSRWRWQVGHSWKNISYMSQHTMQVGHNQSFIFYMSPINLESDRALDFLKKHMQICLLKKWSGKIQFRNNPEVLKIY